MASLQFDDGKCKGADQAKAMFRHDDQAERLKANHSNPDIDKTLTSQNFDIAGLSYPEICEKYDMRIAELDSTTNRNKRSDRVTCFGIGVPAPKDLPAEQYKAWFSRAAEVLTGYYGEQNFLDMKVHLDEVHSYTDARTGKETQSRVHGIARFVPEHDGQLNGKWFSSRANIRKMNRAIDEMTRKEFGICYLDGTQAKSGKSVDQLKQESKLAAIQVQTEQAQMQLDTLKATVVAQEALRDDLQAQVTRYPQDCEKRLKSLDMALQGIQDTDAVAWMQSHSIRRKGDDGKMRSVSVYDWYQSDRQAALEQAEAARIAAEQRQQEIAKADMERREREKAEQAEQAQNKAERPLPKNGTDLFRQALSESMQKFKEQEGDRSL